MYRIYSVLGSLFYSGFLYGMIGATAAAYLSVTVWAGETGIEHDFLKAFAVFLLEISYKGIISLVVWKIIIHYIILKECKITTFNE